MAKTTPRSVPSAAILPSAPRVVSRPATGDLMDVWSRSGSKYRIRAVVLLTANILLFAAVGSFAFWLRSGEMFAPARDGYWDLLAQTFRGVGRAEVSLGSLLIDPISVQDVPMQIPIVGLLMAALISIPILVAILYRFWSSLPLIAVVGFLAVMPWLAVTLLGSCILASVRPFRTRFRFISALIGLVPAIVYLTLAWSGTTDAVVGRIDPVDRIKFVAPWVLAIVASTLVFAIVLAIAKIVDYRPGAVTPLLAVMFVLPVALFEFHVGRDELYYRLLEKLDQAHFAEVDASGEWQQAALRAWERHPLPRPPWDAIREVEEEKWLFELATDIGPRQSELTRHQAELADRCDWFHRYFPDSPYTPNALFIKARAWDRRVDLAEFKAGKWIRFYDDFPSPASRETWRIILENRPDTALGAVALLRIAQFEARDGDVERAISKLGALLAKFDTTALTTPSLPAPAGATKGVLARGTPEATLDIRLERIVLEAHRLRDLLVSNRDPIYEYDPICGSRHTDDSPRWGLLDLDPRHERYVEQLEAIKTNYPNCQIEDNIDLEIAKATPSLTARIERLEALLQKFPRGDAAAEALLRLGMAYQTGEDASRSDEAFARLTRDWPDSIWTRQAAGYVPWTSRTQLTKAGP